MVNSTNLGILNSNQQDMTMTIQIPAHGGQLINLYADEQSINAEKEKAQNIAKTPQIGFFCGSYQIISRRRRRAMKAKPTAENPTKG